MQCREMIVMIMDEPTIGWAGNKVLFDIDTWDHFLVSAQLTPVGINFYKYYDGRWNRYERLRFDRCEVQANYPTYICNHTKQERSRTLKEILQNRG